MLWKLAVGHPPVNRRTAKADPVLHPRQTDTPGNPAGLSRYPVDLFTQDDLPARRAGSRPLRNPTALAVRPGLGQLWAVVNERDELGPNFDPDYLTSGRGGAFYGRPYAWWGKSRQARPAAQAGDGEKDRTTRL